MAKSRGFTYRGGDRTVEDVNRRAKQTSGLYDSTTLDGFVTFKAREGENTIRILPPTWKDTEKYGNNWELPVYMHFSIGPDSGSFLCLDKMKGEPCPICEARRETSDDDERYKLAPSLRPLAWLIDRGDEKAGPQLWAMPHKKIFRVINARSIDKKSGGVILIDDPEEGYDVSFFREGTDMRTDYTGVEVLRDPTPLHDNEKTQQKWLDYIQEHPLPDVLNFQDADYIEKVLSGKVASRKRGDDAEEEEEEATTRRPAARRRPVEAEEEEEAEVEGEEAPTPSSRRAGRRPQAEEEEVEEEAPPRSRRRGGEPPEEEEEEAPAPRRTARRAPEPEEDDPPPRSRRGRTEPEEEEAEDPPPRTTRRARAESEEEEDPPQSRTARKGLERLRPGARR